MTIAAREASKTKRLTASAGPSNQTDQPEPESEPKAEIDKDDYVDEENENNAMDAEEQDQ